MIDTTRYPKMNDTQHDRPRLTVYGSNAFGELIWLAIPLIALALVALLR